MIVDALAAILFGLLEPLVGVLPSIDVSGYLTGAETIGRHVKAVDAWVPIQSLLQLVADVLSWGQWFIPLALFVWVWKLIPGKAT